MSHGETAQPPAARRAPPERPQPYAAYARELCDLVVDFMGQGYSLTAFAGHIGVSRATLKAWMGAHPEFAAAAERGRAARTCLLEQQFLDGGTGAKVAAHVFALKNAAPEDWRDRPAADDGERALKVEITMPENGRGDGDG